MLEIKFGFASASRWLPKSFFLALAETALKHLQVKGKVILDVHVVDVVAMTEVNQTYRHKAGATDVISFALEEGLNLLPDQFGGRHLGEIYLCYPYIAAQARARSQTIRSEVAFIFVHGLLHLTGYDHQTDAEEQQMNTLNQRIIDQFYEKTH